MALWLWQKLLLRRIVNNWFFKYVCLKRLQSWIMFLFAVLVGSYLGKKVSEIKITHNGLVPLEKKVAAGFCGYQIGYSELLVLRPTKLRQ